MDRRVKWQREHIAKGLCSTCGKRRLKTKFKCRKCSKLNAAYNLAKYHLTKAKNQE